MNSRESFNRWTEECNPVLTVHSPAVEQTPRPGWLKTTNLNWVQNRDRQDSGVSEENWSPCYCQQQHWQIYDALPTLKLTNIFSTLYLKEWSFWSHICCEAQVIWTVVIWLKVVWAFMCHWPCNACWSWLMVMVKCVHVYRWGQTGLLTLCGGEALVQSKDLWSVLRPSSCWTCLGLPSSCRAWLLPLSATDMLHIKSGILLLQLSLIHLYNSLQISFPSTLTLPPFLFNYFSPV